MPQDPATAPPPTPAQVARLARKVARMTKHAREASPRSSANRAAAKVRARAEQARIDTQLARERDTERVAKARAFARNRVTAPDDEVWEMLLTGASTGEEVADQLAVTPGNLATWMRAPERAAAYLDFLERRGLLSALSVRKLSADQARDPQCRAVELKANTWEAEAMGRATFGRTAEAPAGAALGTVLMQIEFITPRPVLEPPRPEREVGPIKSERT